MGLSVILLHNITKVEQYLYKKYVSIKKDFLFKHIYIKGLIYL